MSICSGCLMYSLHVHDHEVLASIYGLHACRLWNAAKGMQCTTCTCFMMTAALMQPRVASGPASECAGLVTLDAPGCLHLLPANAGLLWPAVAVDAFC